MDARDRLPLAAKGGVVMHPDLTLFDLQNELRRLRQDRERAMVFLRWLHEHLITADPESVVALILRTEFPEAQQRLPVAEREFELLGQR